MSGDARQSPRGIPRENWSVGEDVHVRIGTRLSLMVENDPREVLDAREFVISLVIDDPKRGGREIHVATETQIPTTGLDLPEPSAAVIRREVDALEAYVRRHLAGGDGRRRRKCTA